ncbi:hypothetical protein AGMMS50267_13820 [Spirochaetia bacterium]|nr:hypothetical protein AGMMS50267_13820 [Spirochaetia bacterium]
MNSSHKEGTVTKKRKIGFSLIGAGIVLALGLAVAGCSDIFTQPKPTEPVTLGTADGGLTRHDYLALLKTQDNHKVSVEALQEMASTLLQTNKIARSVAPAGSVITGTKQLTSLGGKHFTSSGSARSAVAVEEEPIELYELTIGDPEGDDAGFILASNDDRVGNFLAIAEGSLEEINEDFAAILNENLAAYIDETIAMYDRITDADIEAAIEKAIAEESDGARTLSTHWNGIDNNWHAIGCASDFTPIKDALIKTKWGQGAPYSKYINARVYDYGYVTGCTVTAIAQIVAYYGHLKSTTPYKAGNFNNSSFNNAYAGVWNGTYDWANLKAGYLNSDALKGQAAALMWQVGSNVKAKFYDNKGSTVTPIFDADQPLYTGFKNMGYQLFGYNFFNKGMFHATEIVDGNLGSIIFYDNNSPSLVIAGLLNDLPILMYGATMDNTNAHSWVIDGLGAMTYYLEVLQYGQTNLTSAVLVTLNNSMMVHCNYGWNGQGNGWYVYGLFDTGNKLLVGGTDQGGPSYNFSRNVKITIPIPE